MSNTYRYRLLVRTLSPVAISRFHRHDQTVRTLDYLPGTSLRGALAAALLATLDGRPDRELFPPLFTGDAVRYGNLHPLHGPDQPPGLRVSWPLPVTAATCKREPGFYHADPPEQGGHGALDTLAAWLTERSGEERFEYCPTCSGGLDEFAGFYEQVAEEPKRFRTAEPRRRLVARTAMDNRLGTADHGRLYTIEVIEEGQAFAGYLEVRANSADEAHSLVDGLLDRINGQFWIGAARTRGLGHIQVDDLAPAQPLPPLTQRLDRFASKLQEVAGEEFEPDTLFIPVTLLSDMILLDRYLRFQIALDVEALQDYARAWEDPPPLPQGLARHDHFFCRTRRVSGWNVAHQLPRWDDLAIARGSVFVFTVPVAQRAAAEAFFARLEREGIGERRAEGFGRLIIAHPFHSEVNPV